MRSEEDWMLVCEESREAYESGGFLLERLGADRYLDPKLMATILSLRRRLLKAALPATFRATSRRISNRPCR